MAIKILGAIECIFANTYGMVCLPEHEERAVLLDLDLESHLSSRESRQNMKKEHKRKVQTKTN
jgi:hypothetical protein